MLLIDCSSVVNRPSVSDSWRGLGLSIKRLRQSETNEALKSEVKGNDELDSRVYELEQTWRRYREGKNQGNRATGCSSWVDFAGGCSALGKVDSFGKSRIWRRRVPNKRRRRRRTSKYDRNRKVV